MDRLKKVHPDVFSGAVLLGVAVAYGWGALGIPHVDGEPGPRFLPFMLALTLGVLSIWIMAGGLRAARVEPTQPEPEPGAGRSAASIWGRPAVAASITAVYAVALTPIGFALSTLIYAAGVTSLFTGDRRYLLTVPPLVTLVLYVFFGVALGVSLPAGIMG